MQPASDKVLATMAWDSNLNGFRNENGIVRAVKCGLLLAEDQVTLQPGDVFYRLVAATFIDESASQGKHEVVVDIIDENGRRLDGSVARHGWPWERWPATDGTDDITVFGAQPAKWELWADYPADRTEYGPYWVKVKGVSDVFFGMGLPFKHHVSFVAVYQRMVYGEIDPEPTGDLDARLEMIQHKIELLAERFDVVFK